MPRASCRTKESTPPVTMPALPPHSIPDYSARPGWNVVNFLSGPSPHQQLVGPRELPYPGVRDLPPLERAPVLEVTALQVALRDLVDIKGVERGEVVDPDAGPCAAADRGGTS